MDMSQNAVNEDTTALTRNLDMLERKLFTAGNGADKAFNAWRRRRYVLPPPRTVRVASGHSVPPTWCCCDSGLPRGWGYRLCGRAAVERGIAWTRCGCCSMCASVRVSRLTSVARGCRGQCHVRAVFFMEWFLWVGCFGAGTTSSPPRYPWMQPLANASVRHNVRGGVCKKNPMLPQRTEPSTRTLKYSTRATRAHGHTCGHTPSTAAHTPKIAKNSHRFLHLPGSIMSQ